MRPSSIQRDPENPPGARRPLPHRNPLVHRKHRQEVLWQITLPLLIGVAVVLALAVLVSLAGAAQASRWADISLIWLILPALVACLLVTALVGGLIYLLLLAIGKLPPYARLVQDFFLKVKAGVRKASDKAVEPVLRVEGWKASWQALWGRRR